MTNNLNIALQAAKQDWKLFPAYWKRKNHQPMIKWATESSSDSTQIKAWAKRWPGCYFCVALRQSNLSVLDIDNKKGKNGANSLIDLELDNDCLPPTLTSKTPNDGEHYFFSGASAIKVGKLGPGIDTPVMVPLPGSTVEGKGKYKIIKKQAPAPLPDWLGELIGESREQSAERSVPAIEEDLTHYVAECTKYLIEDAPPSIEGDGGDTNAYNVACAVRDYGLSETTALDLMLRFWNDRCEPPWSVEELKRKVENAYQYAHSQAGDTKPESDFSAIPSDGLIQFASFNNLTERIIPPAWLIKKYFEKETVVLFFGDSGAYKSFIAIDIGLHIAAGKPWLGKKTERGPVFYIAGEGHGGIRRRLRAWKDHHNIKGNIPFYVSPYSIQLDKAKSTTELIKSVKAYNQPPALVVIDTLAASFGGADENSTKDMNTFLNHVQGIRQALRCAVIVVHHTGHQAKERPRGAYALLAGVDAAYCIERTEDGLTCLRFPRKMKDGVPAPDTWFKTQTIKIGVDEDLESITSLIMDHQAEYKEEIAIGRLGVNQALVLDIVTKAGGQISIDQAREEFKSRKIDMGVKYQRYSYNVARESLEKKDLIKADGNMLSGNNGNNGNIAGVDIVDGGWQ